MRFSSLDPTLAELDALLSRCTVDEKITIVRNAARLFLVESRKLEHVLEEVTRVTFEEAFSRLSNLDEYPESWVPVDIPEDSDHELLEFQICTSVFGINSLECDLNTVLTTRMLSAIDFVAEGLRCGDLDSVLFELVAQAIDVVETCCERRKQEFQEFAGKYVSLIVESVIASR